MAVFDRLGGAYRAMYQKPMLDIIGESGSAAAPRLQRDLRAELAAVRLFNRIYFLAVRPSCWRDNIGARMRWPTMS